MITLHYNTYINICNYIYIYATIHIYHTFTSVNICMYRLNTYWKRDTKLLRVLGLGKNGMGGCKKKKFLNIH